MIVDETLVILVEECSEVTQIVAKSARFGFSSWHPLDESRTTNWDLLAQEIADLEVMIDLSKKLLMFDEEKMQKLRQNKLQSLIDNSSIGIDAIKGSKYYEVS